MSPGEARTPAIRRPHRKSRRGCLTCKARHLKCDEKKPRCAKCEKYGSPCEYPPLKSVVSPEVALSPAGFNSPSSTQNTALDGPNNDPIASQDLIADISNLRLLHHFTTVTAHTLAHEPDVVDIFSCYMPQVAFDNVFLLHAILSLTACHLSKSESHSRHTYLLQAKRHHQIALTQFRNEVKDITESNVHPVLFFNVSIFPYSCAISASSENPEDAFESLFSSLLLSRMIGPLVQASGLYETMRKSDFGRIMPKDVHSVKWETAEAPAETELVQLRKFSGIIHHIYAPDILKAYKEAIRVLEILFDAKGRLSKPPSDSFLRMWIHLIPARFIELLSERQPGALIIFAHYGVILGRGRHYWYLEGIDELILAVADAFVPTEWRNWLDWPKEQIRGGHITPYSQPA